MGPLEAANIYVKPNEAWGFFEDSRACFKPLGDIIAEDFDNDIEVRLRENYDGEPIVTVYVSGRIVEEIEVSTETGLRDELEQIYGDYFPSVVCASEDKESDDDGDDDSMSPEEFKAEYFAREGELEDAINWLLETLVGSEYDMLLKRSDKKELIDHICEFAFRKIGVSVYRPMVIEIDGEKKAYGYPYEKMEYEPDPVLYPDE